MSTQKQDGRAPSIVGDGEESILRVSGGTDCHKLASAIAGAVERNESRCIVEYVGAGAGNQAIKGVIIANNLLATTGVYLSVIPMFCKRPMADNPDAVAVQLRTLVHRT